MNTLTTYQQDFQIDIKPLYQRNTLPKMQNLLSKMQTTLESILEAVVWVDAANCIQWHNSAFANLLNEPQTELIGLRLRDILPLSQDGKPITVEAYPDIRIRRGTYKVTEYQCQRSQSTLNLEIIGSCIEKKKEESTVILAIRAIATNSSLQTNTQADLCRSNSLLKAQQEASLDGILVVDEHNRVVSYNQRFCQLWQIPTETIASGNDRLLLNYVMSELVRPEAFLTEVNYLYEHPLETSCDEIFFKDGRVFERYSSPVRSPLGVYYGRVWYFRDISERKRIEIAQAQLLEREKQQNQALEEAKLGAETANRVKSEFIANMSHELRTPLNAILGFVQLSLEDKTLDSKQKERLRIVKRSGEHLLNLINDVLEMSKIEMGNTQLESNPFDLRQLLHSLDVMFRPMAKAKGLSLQFQLAADLPNYINSDERKLQQILVNLLENAIKYTPTGGVTLRASLKEKERSTTIVFEVEDTGIGIASEEGEILFEPFVQTTTNRDKGGMGLGLAMSHHFAGLMSGELQFSSAVGQGSLFSLAIAVDLVPLSEVENSCCQYEQINSASLMSLPKLSPQNLRCMPLEWIESLHQAAIQVDADLIRQLIAEIPAKKANIAQNLTNLLLDYNFDEILDLTKL
jgi:signal transduction histidine kinase